MTPLTPLDVFREHMGYHPWHFWGLADTNAAEPIVPVTDSCNSLVRQHGYQTPSEQVGRSEIRRALEAAEQQLFDYLHYAVAPRYAEKVLPWPKYQDWRLMRTAPVDALGRWLAVNLHDGYVDSIGIEQRTLIATPTVTYTDEDGDGLNETFTLSAPTTVTDPDEIAIYIAAADRFNDSAISERWRIQPVSISIDSGTVTVTGKAWLLVRPILYEGFGQSVNGLAPTNSSNFVATLDIYRRYTDPDGTTLDTSQAVIEWETRPCYGWWCIYCADTLPSGSERDPAAVARAIARCGIRNAKLGIVHAAQALYNTESQTWSSPAWWTCCDEPDRVTVRYLAGYPRPTELYPIVVRLAAANLAASICTCDVANRELYHWQFDMSRVAGANDESYAISAENLNNPLGTRRGHAYAWHQIKNLQQRGGIVAG